jgi:hypothetical protein
VPKHSVKEQCAASPPLHHHSSSFTVFLLTATKHKAKVALKPQKSSGFQTGMAQKAKP